MLRHGEFTSETKSPEQGNRIDVTYLPAQPSVSVPFAKRELDASDVGKARDNDGLGAFGLSAILMIAGGMFANIFGLETRLARDGIPTMARLVSVTGAAGSTGQRRVRYAYYVAEREIEQSELWFVGGAPRRNTVVTVIYRRNGNRFESHLAENFIFRDPPESRRWAGPSATADGRPEAAERTETD